MNKGVIIGVAIVIIISGIALSITLGTETEIQDITSEETSLDETQNEEGKSFTLDLVDSVNLSSKRVCAWSKYSSINLKSSSESSLTNSSSV